METLLIYLLNASAGIGLFYLVYWFFLRKETFHVANRWFMFAALLSSVLLPLFPVQYTVLVESGSSEGALTSIADSFKNLPIVSANANAESGFSWQQAAGIVYCTGAFIFLLRLLTQTVILLHLMLKYRIKSLNGMRIVENEKYGLPFSFFNIVFINPKFHTQDELPEILAHEKVHIRENHWFDLLFIELLTVIFWFNPFIWFFERSIKQNHEYLADKGVLAQGHTVGRYQALLVNQLMGMQIIGITNNLNFALNANRLKMMTKKKTHPLQGLKFVWALPALALLLFAFAEPKYRNPETITKEKTVTADKAVQKLVELQGTVKDENGKALTGTSVIIEGTTEGTVVDRDGTFSLKVPDHGNVVFSYVGKQTIRLSLEELRHSENGVIDKTIVMKDAVQVLFNRDFSGEQLVPPPPPPPPAKASEPAKETIPPPPPPKTEKGEEVFYIVEDMPKYPGGFEALQDHVAKMQHKLAQGKNLKGKATVSFTVDAKGKVSEIKVVEKDNDGAAKGAVAIASEMPDWKPGYQRGKAVPVKYLLPVEFK